MFPIQMRQPYFFPEEEEEERGKGAFSHSLLFSAAGVSVEVMDEAGRAGR